MPIYKRVWTTASSGGYIQRWVRLHACRKSWAATTLLPGSSRGRRAWMAAGHDYFSAFRRRAYSSKARPLKCPASWISISLSVVHSAPRCSTYSNVASAVSPLKRSMGRVCTRYILGCRESVGDALGNPRGAATQLTPLQVLPPSGAFISLPPPSPSFSNERAWFLAFPESRRPIASQSLRVSVGRLSTTKKIMDIYMHSVYCSKSLISFSTL